MQFNGTDENEAHILLHFHRKYTAHWIKEWATALDINVPAHIVQEYMLPFLLESRPEEGVRREIREMLRNMIRAELKQTDGCDPGGNEVDLLRMERRTGESRDHHYQF